MNDNILWKRKVVISDTHSRMFEMGLFSARALRHRYALWLSLLFNYVYMEQWRRQFSFLKSCKATYSIKCLFSYTANVFLFQGNYGSLNFHTHTWKGFPSPAVTVTQSQVLLLAAWRFEWCKTGDLALQVFKPAHTHDSLSHASIYCVCACVCGDCDAITSTVLPTVWLRDLFSLCHIHFYTSTGFHNIKSYWFGIWLQINFKNQMPFGYLICVQHYRKIVLEKNY